MKVRNRNSPLLGSLLPVTFLFLVSSVLSPSSSNQAWATPRITAAPANADASYTIRAGFILNFLKLTSFNSSPKQYELCVRDNDKTYQVFKALEKRDVQSKALKVSNLSSLNQAASCSAVYVGSDFDKEFQNVADKLRDSGVLSIGEGEEFLAAGGLIGFTEENRKLRFSVNLERSKSAGLKMSSQLLRLAKIYEE